jgi:mycofactocin precursor
MNDQQIENKEEQQIMASEEQNENTTSDIFTTSEVEIEEVAIDGICGVY